jgi:predicted PurR-regulated permease PerM
MFFSPVIYQQIVNTATKLSALQDQVQSQGVPIITEWLSTLSPNLLTNLQESIKAASGSAIGLSGEIISSFIKKSSIAFDIAIFLLLIPLITCQMLQNWNVMIAAFLQIFPKKMQPTIKEFMQAIDNTMNGYCKGQLYVCAIMSIYYIIALKALSIDSFFALGLLSGILVAVPYIGALTAGFLCILASIMQEGLNHAGIAFLVFLIGNIVESNFITPKLIGIKVELHPIWLLFGLLVSSSLLGFTGILIAVPLTAALGTAIKFAMARYKRSEFYRGRL